MNSNPFRSSGNSTNPFGATKSGSCTNGTRSPFKKDTQPSSGPFNKPSSDQKPNNPFGNKTTSSRAFGNDKVKYISTSLKNIPDFTSKLKINFTSHLIFSTNF